MTNSPLSNLKGFFWAKTLNALSNQLVRPPGGAALGRSLKKIIFVLSFCHFAFAGTNSNDSRRQLLKYSRHHSFSLDSTHDEAASCPRIQTDGQADMPTAWWSSALRSRSISHPLDGGRFSIDLNSIKKKLIKLFWNTITKRDRLWKDWIDCLMYLSTCNHI